MCGEKISPIYSITVKHECCHLKTNHSYVIHEVNAFFLGTEIQSEGDLTLKHTFLLLITPTSGGHCVTVGDIITSARK